MPDVSLALDRSVQLAEKGPSGQSQHTSKLDRLVARRDLQVPCC
jgi:hypothetical protein